MKNCNLQSIINDFTSGHATSEDIFQTPVGRLGPNRKTFIRRMILDELQGFDEATTLEEQVDALVDLVYYIGDFCNRNGLPFDRVFDAVHAETITYFEAYRGALARELERTFIAFIQANSIFAPSVKGVRESDLSEEEQCIHLRSLLMEPTAVHRMIEEVEA